MTNRTVPNSMHSGERRRILDSATAHRLARQATVARLIGHDHFGPTIDIVSIVWIGTRVYFYADGRSRLGRSVLDSAVVLEVDAEDGVRTTDSTVVIHGIARAVVDVRLEVLEDLLPRPHSDGPPMHRLVEVSPTSVSGVELARCPIADEKDRPARRDTCPSGPVRVDSDSITVEIPTEPRPRKFPVTTAAIDGVVRAVMIAEYGPASGVSPDGHLLRTAVLDRWPGARVLERRSAGERGADPRGYESFYVELEPSGCRTDIDLVEVSALFGR
ncbi:hypothetical protein CH254_00020 [Rhodococcus sp. 06-412-2C]|uniref:hypothetical protein n=1 Tax=unclassified Rhodococcus (in: high G+C Gram-positive bacteria) TaxID=192944 RepID=UPI000B9AE725|nr:MULTISPECIES: hypothetical protein [unclassified Rhodococcus (in: high G+C Gram-positive bacteria)]OZC89974.1 hypothetical protein CH279_29865 [Rhodococcus sp. 06-412-2B]OZC94754.1 hypothetical protein CH254_00020 [Rhodococcus sp. 06-412-2C]